MKVVLITFLVFCAVVAQTNACNPGLSDPNVCLYGTASLDGTTSTDPTRTSCQQVNSNPFAFPVAPGSSDVTAEQCEEYARIDGSACVTFYSSYACSSYCSLCNHVPCQYFCDNYASICPTATAGHCFQSIFCVDGVAGTTCSQWEVDSSKIPAAPSTTHTTTTTTKTTKATTTHTTHTTTSHTGTDTTTEDFTSSSYSIGASVGLVALTVVLQFP
jgi:hypothetical protein